MKRISLFVMMLACVGMIHAKSVINYVYDDTQMYTAGNGSTQETLHAIDIDWVSGNISVIYGDVQVPTWTEKPVPSDDEPQLKMHYSIQHGKLVIKYCQSGRWKIKKDSWKKDLVLTLPRNTAYKDIEIETVNGDVTVSVRADKVSVETVNGDVQVQNLMPAREIDIESVNGALTIVQPQDKGFLVDYETVVGKFSSDIQGTYSSSRDEGHFYTDGVPDTEISMETVNGSIQIKKAKK